jgi:hypothetical protein
MTRSSDEPQIEHPGLPSRSAVWTGLAEVAPDSDAAIDMLEGAGGGFVTVASLAIDRKDFEGKLGHAMASLELRLLSLEDVERRSSSDADPEPGSELARLHTQARAGHVAFGTFHTYDTDDDV